MISYLETLGRAFDRDEFEQLLRVEPEWSPEAREGEVLDRQAGVASLSNAFFPLPRHRWLAAEVQTILRAGYANRAVDRKFVRPLNRNRTSQGVKYSYKGFDVTLNRDNSHLSGTLLGLPGMGKTSVINRILSVYNRRIEHEGLSPQLTSLVIKCPVVPTVKGFCLAFLDALAGATDDPNVRGAFGHSEAWIEGLPDEVEQLARNHAIGLLVVDDIQHLCSAGDKERRGVFDTFGRLSSSAGIPVMLVGTNAAAEVISNSPRAAMRSVGYGSDVWNRLDKGEEWEIFIAQLWRFQWTRNETPLTPELSAAFYDACQGIVGLAIKLYQRVQSAIIRQADVIRNLPCTEDDECIKNEIITLEFVQGVRDYLFKPVQRFLDALRSEDPAKLDAFEDLRPVRSEAKRVADKKLVEGQPESDLPEPAAPLLSEEQMAELSDEELAKEAGAITRVQAEMRAMARRIFEQEGCTESEIEKHLSDIEDVLGHKIHEQNRKFFKEIEGRLKARNSRLRRADDPDEDGDTRVYEHGDLRGLLGRGVDVRAELRKAGYDWHTGMWLAV